MLRAALSVVAAAVTPLAAVGEHVTIRAQPAIVKWNDHLVLSGTVASGRADESVTVERKACRATAFEVVTTTRTTAGGRWSVDVWIGGGPGDYRARWQTRPSAPVTVQYRPGVLLAQISRDRFEITVTALEYFSGKRALLQRQERRLGRWTTIKSVVLKEAAGGRTSSTFRADVPRRTILRAVLPLAAAKPCYLAGYSRSIRT